MASAGLIANLLLRDGRLFKVAYVYYTCSDESLEALIDRAGNPYRYLAGNVEFPSSCWRMQGE